MLSLCTRSGTMIIAMMRRNHATSLYAGPPANYVDANGPAAHPQWEAQSTNAGVAIGSESRLSVFISRLMSVMQFWASAQSFWRLDVVVRDGVLARHYILHDVRKAEVLHLNTYTPQSCSK